MTPNPAVSPGLRFLLSAASLVIVVAGLRAASTILVPLALAVFVAVVSLPLLNLARRKGIPTVLSILGVVLIDASALFVFGWLVSLAALEVQNELPGYLQRLQDLEAVVIAWLGERGIEVEQVATLWFPTGEGGSTLWSSVDLQRLLNLATYLVGKATDILTMVFLVVLLFVFILAEAPTFPRRFRLVAGQSEGGLSRSAKIVSELQHYLAIKTLISAGTGLTIGMAMWGIGVDFPLLWGLLAFVLNFIPNVGSILAAIPSILISLLQIGPGTALLVTTVYIAVNALFGSFLEPLWVGRQLGISTLVVILSLLFWGWVWGPVGMFLSVPLTMGLKIALENSEEFRWIAVLMSADRPRRGREAPPLVASVPAASTQE